MRIMQVDKDDKLVADFGPPLPDDTPAAPAPEDPPATIITPTPPARTPPRPSLEVETEVHAHLAPRLEAHLRRIESWDMRALPPDGTLVDVAATVGRIRSEFELLGGALKELAEVGFVAKSTALTRKRAALRPGVAVKLREDIHAKTVDLFVGSPELDTLTVAAVGESSVLLKTESGRELGPFPIAHVVLA